MEKASTAGPVRVGVLDKDVLAQYGLHSLLSRSEGIVIVSQIRELGEITRELAGDLDVLLADVDTVMVGDHDLAEAMSSLAQDVPVVAISSHVDAKSVVACLRAGAAGFIWKGCDVDDFQKGVQGAALGEHPILPPIAGDLLFHVLKTNVRQQRTLVGGLTAREQEVLRALANGLSNKEIATALNLSVRTVKAHVSSILQKLGVADRTQAALLAVRSGADAELPRSVAAP